ncbi:MAG: hypothetical protein BIFFINMI_00861 [Phycisphaerae bacterium]|nr:hypothetical protein [Phycisphaerae bacterium]
MSSARRGLVRTGLAVMCLVPMLLAGGCGGSPPQYGAQVVAVPSRDVIALSADDIVRLMQRAGFEDFDIVELGTELRNDLATAGAAKIQRGDKVETIFAVEGDCVYVSSHYSGSAIYDVKAGRFR